MKRAVLFLLVLTGCTIEVPIDELEVPPIENNTTIVVNMPDWLSVGTVPGTEDVQEAPETVDDTQRCKYQHFPDYYTHYDAFVLGCTGDVDDDSDFVCCTWVFPEDRQACEERWCRKSNDICGWALNSWECYSY